MENLTHITTLVGGLEHCLFSHILGIIIPTDELIFLRGVETTNQPILQQFFEVTMVSINIKILVEFSKDGYHGHGLRIFRGRH